MTSMSGERNKSIVFLFGAGASAAAANSVVPRRPPLGRELYDELAAFSPATWGPGSYLASYADGFRDDFEAAMNQLVGRIPSLSLLEWLRDLSRYFAQFTVDGTGADPYSELLHRLQERNAIDACVFASLNYECLLELAGMTIGLQV